jgi:imidazolonepropionase
VNPPSLFRPDAQTRHLWRDVRLVTLDPAAGEGLGVSEDAVLAVGRDGAIQWLGPAASLDEGGLNDGVFNGEVHEGGGRWITPGFIDPHTHLVWGGQRADEFQQRQQGASYAEIAAAGGGIQSTVRAMRACSQDELVALALPRLAALCREGVTTVEIKSGYGLSLDEELKQLSAARALGERLPVTVTTTLLAAHAVPPEFRDDPDGYVDEVCERILPAAAARGLADAVDAFCEGVGFTPAQVERVFEAAHRYDLPVKLHAEQLSNLGGAALAARHGALSADHLEYLDDDGVAAMADHGTVAVLLPGAFYFLRETQAPPVDALRQAGVPMALATDLNPGTSPFASLRMAMNQAAVLFGLTPDECLAAVTRNAARALGMDDRGVLAVGQRADLLVWDFDTPAELTYAVGFPSPVARFVAGEPADA